MMLWVVEREKRRLVKALIRKIQVKRKGPVEQMTLSKKANTRRG
uniref:Uncharacterized protein n=1 Tax=Picea sitchensis TaxID=3332 RepID=A9NY90_PICSI|nr:unknown [Picea sitchensis]